MTQQELIEKINTVLADEFEVEQEVITPMRRCSKRSTSTASIWWMSWCSSTRISA